MYIFPPDDYIWYKLPGVFYDIQVLHDRKIIEVYALREESRHISVRLCHCALCLGAHASSRSVC